MCTRIEKTNTLRITNVLLNNKTIQTRYRILLRNVIVIARNNTGIVLNLTLSSLEVKPILNTTHSKDYQNKNNKLCFWQIYSITLNDERNCHS